MKNKPRIEAGAVAQALLVRIAATKTEDLGASAQVRQIADDDRRGKGERQPPAPAAVERRTNYDREKLKPFVEDLMTWLNGQRRGLSPKSETAKAIDYGLKRMVAFTRFLDDGRICLSNNAAERAMRCIAVGRKKWTFAGSDAGGRRAAAIYTLIETAKINDVDPRAWLADILYRLPDHPAKRIHELLPWNWSPKISTTAQDTQIGFRRICESARRPSPDAFPRSSASA